MHKAHTGNGYAFDCLTPNKRMPHLYHLILIPRLCAFNLLLT
ncbi:hypothetical protein P20311_2824 [Pseudoalteromonas sp. BSi20311]|nr:hypothetical protein P20311_2824 [Pseudoalteromonas sp. BSi20311]